MSRFGFNVRINKCTDKGYTHRLSFYLGGKRERPRFRTKKEALDFKRQIEKEQRSLGDKGAELLHQNKEEAMQALRVLEGQGSIIEAANHYKEQNLSFESKKTISDHLEDLIKIRKIQKRSHRTIQYLRCRTRSFIESYGNCLPKELVQFEVQNWFQQNARNRQWSGLTMVHTKDVCSQLMNHIIEKEQLAKNPFKGIPLPSVETKEPEIYGLREIVSLLYHAPEFGLQNYIALGLFAGLRPEREALKIRTEDFHFDTKQIWVPRRLGKSNYRSVDIKPVLYNWLVKHYPNQDPITIKTNLSERRKKLASRAGVLWIKDGLRHTYGSMLFAETGDKNYTIGQMGHRGNDKIFNDHYKRLVSRQTARAFWNLTPEMVSECYSNTSLLEEFYSDVHRIDKSKTSADCAIGIDESIMFENKFFTHPVLNEVC